jgi:ribosomal protein L40E
MVLQLDDISKAMDLYRNKVQNRVYFHPNPQDELISLDIEKQDFLTHWEKYCREKALEQSLELKICGSCDTENKINAHSCKTCMYEFSTSIRDINVLQEATPKKIYKIYYD